MRKINQGLSEEEQRRMDELKVLCPRCGEYQWPLNDENTLTQGDPACACSNGNLDIFYPDAFIQNEELQVLDNSNHGITILQTMYTPVIPGTMFGTIDWTFGGFKYASFSFNINSEGQLDVTRLGPDGKPVPTFEEELKNGTITSYYDEIHVCESKLNHITGVLEIHWHSSEPPNKIIACYEYNKEGK